MTQTVFDYSAAATDFYRELDSNEPDVFERRLTIDAVFAFNDYDPVPGRDAIAAFVGDWKANFASLTHEIIRVTADPVQCAVGVELTVAYQFPDGRVEKIKGCSFLDFAGDRISGYRVYVDTSRLA
ncbi:nuclear transport factor 2 family protein [Rhodococcus koreensis]|uniref:SnoaL-like domain-containing protein n=1 Tax=Rhodococcus koreensis TaxID=99653 RepID=A0A1H4XKD8_9NOCA|nr:nuclear transport factor 2 family protein [Rhodococcus koreensis]SED06086.1 SnoaL-like domain-containing protein [Rhodococcus koreensis]